MENRAGCYIKNLYGDMAYESFKPSLLPPVPPIEIDEDMLIKLIEANKNIAVLNSLSSRIPNVELFVSMYVRKEALLSSQIEGTQCTLDDILSPYIDTNVNQDVSDVVNYIKATEFAIERLKTLPICSRLIKETHAILLQGLRGSEKNPGEYRHSQNWIGGAGSTIKNARYIPPNPEDMLNAMSNLEKFINSDTSLDPLIVSALIHYQFETIHPFLDGNGRVGRLLITLFLMEKNVLATPALYISYYLKMNRLEYYDRMSQVRKNGDYEQWIRFFLEALSESGKEAIEDIDKLSTLHDANINKLSELGTRQAKSAMALFTYLERNPIIDIGKTATALNLSFNTTAKAVSILEEKGILKQTNKSKRSRTYCYSDYLDILRKNT